jgi:tetratricopeptide (TPR) repeat protein
VVIGSMAQFQTLSEGYPLWSILAAAADLLETDPKKAEQQAQEALKFAPGQQQALQLLIGARQAQGDIAGARTLLESMAAETPDLASVHFELGMMLAEAGEDHAAIRSLSRVVELEAAHPQAWRLLGDALVQVGDTDGAAKAYSRQFTSSVMDVKMLEQASALDVDQIEIAENLLREFLNIYPTDLVALQMLGKMYVRANQFESAERLFKRAVDLAPSFAGARLDYISALHLQMKPEEETRQLDILLENDPDNSEYRRLKAMALSASGRTTEAVRCCEDALRAEPDQHNFWLAYAHILRVAGRQKDCIAAYRRTIQIEPRLGEAWWGLANLKTFHFGPSDVETMRTELLREDLTDDNREFLHFALGKALEDDRAYRESFEQYRRGNSLVRARNPYNVDDVAENVAREKRRFTREFFAAHANIGSPSPDPIFIVGMPRSGSTLVEQILASHSSVEGCGELPSFTAIVRDLEAKRIDRDGPASDDAEALFNGKDLKVLGEEYLERCRIYRNLPRPHFTDKMPSNFHHLGFICATLPNAKIIDVRRHPLACCFSNFRQSFPSRLGPSYALTDIGRYYRGYIELLAHFDSVVPGRVYRVIYENLVRNPEREIRQLLEYCDLPFEEACLRFYETDRGIRTISSEQVRQPVYTDSIEQWRHYESWLEPLKTALGPVLDAYPAVPDHF